MQEFSQNGGEGKRLEGLFKAIFNISPVGIYVVNHGRFRFANPQLLRDTGYREDELLGTDSLDLVVPEHQAAVRDHAIRMLKGKCASPLEYKAVAKNGEIRWIMETVTSIEYEAARATLGYFVNITKLKQHEEQMQRNVQHLSALRNIDMIIASSLDLRVVLNVLLDQLIAQLHVDAADVLLFNPHTRYLEYGAGRGFRTRASQHTRLGLGQGYAGQAALDRRIKTVPDLAEDTGGLVLHHLPAEELFVTYVAAPLVAKGQIKGVLEIFHRCRLDPDADWMEFLEILAGQAAIAVDNATLLEEVQRSNLELAVAYDTTLEGWVRALDMRDKETEGHTQRVTEMAVRLGASLGLSDIGLNHIRRGALLHDIGKTAIPDSILMKPGPLTEDEWEVMRRHPVYAYEFLSPIAVLRSSLDIPYCHHERWDGSGYPQGLKGEQIPLIARIFGVVDVWDALRSDRAYRPAWPEKEVRDYIRDGAGTLFDPDVVQAFLSMAESSESVASVPRISNPLRVLRSAS